MRFLKKKSIKRRKAGKRAVSNRKQPKFLEIRPGALTKELGIYLETDILHKSITIGKGRRRIAMTIMQAKMLREMLNHQIRSLSDK